MIKTVQCLIYSSDGKIGKGILEFWNEESFKKYLKDGGSLTIRWEEGDSAIIATPVESSKENHESSNS